MQLMYILQSHFIKHKSPISEELLIYTIYGSEFFGLLFLLSANGDAFLAVAFESCRSPFYFVPHISLSKSFSNNSDALLLGTRSNYVVPNQPKKDPT